MTTKRATPGTGSVYKNPRKPGHWIGKVTIDGTVRRVYAPTKTEAREKLNAVFAAPAIETKPSTTTVAALLKEWLARDISTRDIAPSTETRHRWAAEHLRKEIGPVAIGTLTVRDVEDALDRMATTGLSRASLTKILQTLAQALTFAQRRDDITRNVAALAKVPSEATAAVKRRALSPADARTLLDALDGERNGMMFVLGLRLGLRPGEASGLYWSDLDLDAGTINITRGVRLVKGHAEVVDSLKTAGAKRTLALPHDVIEQLRRHRVAQSAERLAASSWADDRLVFASPRGAVLSPPNVRRQLAGVCARINVERKNSAFPIVKPNELRHSCASYLIDQGVGIEVVADVLGHTSTRMVDVTYRHRLRPIVSATAMVDWTTEVDTAT